MHRVAWFTWQCHQYHYLAKVKDININLKLKQPTGTGRVGKGGPSGTVLADSGGACRRITVQGIVIRLEIKSAINYCARSISLHYLSAHYIGFISNIQLETMRLSLVVVQWPLRCAEPASGRTRAVPDRPEPQARIAFTLGAGCFTWHIIHLNTSRLKRAASIWPNRFHLA